MKPYRLAVTGGPCAAKTTALKVMGEEFGDQILVMPETASLLLDNGFPKPQDLNYSETWLRCFQNSVLQVQRDMEDTYQEMALTKITRLVLCDRGLLDGAAYLGKGLDHFVGLYGLDLDEVYARYDAVIHLETVAAFDPDLYEKLKGTNPARYETAAEAVARDRALQEVWKGHPNWLVVPASLGKKGVVSAVLDILAEYLRKEIEGKYLLPGMPDIPLPEGTPVIQGYFNTRGEMRIRRMGEKNYLTIKGDGSHSRDEDDRRISAWAFDQQWPDTEGRRIYKTRYCIPYEGHTLELDKYLDRHAGLVILECEFRTLEEMADFRLPAWAKDAIDVTHDKRYKNRPLALNGVPR